MTNKLLPCPFCGGEARLTKLNQKGFNGEFKVFVQCSRCKARTNVKYPMPHYSLEARKEAVIKAWNSRAVVGNPATENAALSLDELRGMDREPVWMEKAQTWCFVYLVGKDSFRQVYYFSPRGYSRTVLFEDEKFYRRKPEEETE